MKKSKHAMTLMELIVVMAIIMILAALIGGNILSAREQAKRLQCLSNIRSLGQAAILYAQEDSQSRFPYVTPFGKSMATLYDPSDFNDLTVFACPLERNISLLTPPAPNFNNPNIISYNFVPNETLNASQTDSYPMTNILMIENTVANFSVEDFHGQSGRPSYLISGKAILTKFSGNNKISNQKRDTSTYDVTVPNLYK